MNWFDYEWLGYAPTPEITDRIVWETGFFYLTIAVAYFFSFLYGLWHSTSQKKMKRHHSFSIFLWIFVGGCFLTNYSHLTAYLSILMTFLALRVLYQLRYTSSIISDAAVELPQSNKYNKKTLYAHTLLKKTEYTLQNIISIALMNEQILWLLVLYRSVIAWRASWGI